MARPEILKAVHVLDQSGFYEGSEYLGDLTADSACLDSVKTNGIYTFTAYKDLIGASSAEKCKWCLRVYTSDDGVNVEQTAECFMTLETYKRNYVDGVWSAFNKTFVKIKDVLDEAGTGLDTILANEQARWAGGWIEFTDENGNPTDEPFYHYAVNEDGTPVYAGLTYAEDGEF